MPRWLPTTITPPGIPGDRAGLVARDCPGAALRAFLVPARVIALAAALALAGCSGTRADRPDVAGDASPTATPVGALDPGATELRVLVYRDGPLAAMGHNHVITTATLDGTVMPIDAGEYAIDLRLPVAALAVDDPAARAAAGPDFAAAVDDEARAGTRRNLLGPRLLDAERYPVIGLVGRTRTGANGARSLAITITVRDQPRDFVIPVSIDAASPATTVRGELRMTHAELGLEPFSVMGGMLRVRDELSVGFRAGLAADGGLRATADGAPAAGR